LTLGEAHLLGRPVLDPPELHHAALPLHLAHLLPLLQQEDINIENLGMSVMSSTDGEWRRTGSGGGRGVETRGRVGVDLGAENHADEVCMDRRGQQRRAGLGAHRICISPASSGLHAS